MRQLIGDDVKLKTWGNEQSGSSGYTIVLSTQEQFARFLRAVGEEQ